jgi:hypothetical protein
VFASGRRHGTERSWHVNGRARTEAEYRDGTLVSAAAWDANGRPLSEADALALVKRDETADDAEYRALEELVRKHAPTCTAPRTKPQRVDVPARASRFAAARESVRDWSGLLTIPGGRC